MHFEAISELTNWSVELTKKKKKNSKQTQKSQEEVWMGKIGED